VLEHEPKVEPEVVMAFAPDYGSAQLASLRRFKGGDGARPDLAEGRLRLSPAVHRRLTTPLDWRPQLPGAESYEGRRLPAWHRTLTRLQTDPDAELHG
jgi:hypothetical protein